MSRIKKNQYVSVCCRKNVKLIDLLENFISRQSRLMISSMFMINTVLLKLHGVSNFRIDLKFWGRNLGLIDFHIIK